MRLISGPVVQCREMSRIQQVQFPRILELRPTVVQHKKSVCSRAWQGHYELTVFRLKCALGDYGKVGRVEGELIVYSENELSVLCWEKPSAIGTFNWPITLFYDLSSSGIQEQRHHVIGVCRLCFVSNRRSTVLDVDLKSRSQDIFLGENEALSGSPPTIALVGLLRSALVVKLREINLPKWLRSGNFIGDDAWPASAGKDKSDGQYPLQPTKLYKPPVGSFDIAHETFALNW